MSALLEDELDRIARDHHFPNAVREQAGKLAQRKLDAGARSASFAAYMALLETEEVMV